MIITLPLNSYYYRAAAREASIIPYKPDLVVNNYLLNWIINMNEVRQRTTIICNAYTTPQATFAYNWSNYHIFDHSALTDANYQASVGVW
jgi:hypothetical protein